jgi:hypothetical protein
MKVRKGGRVVDIVVVAPILVVSAGTRIIVRVLVVFSPSGRCAATAVLEGRLLLGG